MLRTKKTHTYTIIVLFKKIISIYTHHLDNHTTDVLILNHFPLISHCIKNTNFQGILRNYDPITQMCLFCPLTKTLNKEESGPLVFPHEYLQPQKIPILEYIHNTKWNHKIYNLIQNTTNEFSISTKELKTIKALQLIWPLLQTKNIIRILAKLLTTSDAIHDVLHHGFFPDD